jgi:hypothetical protein
MVACTVARPPRSDLAFCGREVIATAPARCCFVSRPQATDGSPRSAGRMARGRVGPPPLRKGRSGHQSGWRKEDATFDKILLAVDGSEHSARQPGWRVRSAESRGRGGRASRTRGPVHLGHRRGPRDAGRNLGAGRRHRSRAEGRRGERARGGCPCPPVAHTARTILDVAKEEGAEPSSWAPGASRTGTG